MVSRNTELREKGVRLGVISDPGDETAETIDKILDKSGILEFFEPELRTTSACSSNSSTP